jgi:hypothetical protein
VFIKHILGKNSKNSPGKFVCQGGRGISKNKKEGGKKRKKT